MTVKHIVLKRITDYILKELGDCPILHDVTRGKIYYPVGSLSTIKTDITEPLLALYKHFADLEDKHWKEKLWEKFGSTDIITEKYHFTLDKKPKVYISGRITGLSEEVYKNNFNSVELYLTGLGYDVINPVSYTPIENGTWEDYMKRDLKLLLDCDYIYLLEGWQDSDGASLEYTVAETLGIKVLELDEK